MISFGPVVDDGVSSRREREEICFSKRVTFEFREVFRKLTSASARASLGPKEPPQWGLQYSLLACPCAGLCAASADVPAIGTAVHLDLEPTLPTVRHGRRPEPVLRILRLMALALLRSWDRSLIERSPRTSPPAASEIWR